MIDARLVQWIRRAELESVMPLLPPASQILEIGAGSGDQATVLAEAGHSVSAIDLPDCEYAGFRVFPVADYDGRTLPFPSARFDVVFSSNVLEHVTDLQPLHTEILRVLKPGGRCIHVLPTASWRFWTLLSAFPEALHGLATARRRSDAVKAARRLARAFLPLRHGERGTALSELWLFRRAWWSRHFAAHGFRVLEQRPVGLFYTGNALFGLRWPLPSRHVAARFLGSACRLFLIAPADGN